MRKQLITCNVPFRSRDNTHVYQGIFKSQEKHSKLLWHIYFLLPQDSNVLTRLTTNMPMGKQMGVCVFATQTM